MSKKPWSRGNLNPSIKALSAERNRPKKITNKQTKKNPRTI
jgi:hypothetical protein